MVDRRITSRQHCGLLRLRISRPLLLLLLLLIGVGIGELWLLLIGGSGICRHL